VAAWLSTKTADIIFDKENALAYPARHPTKEAAMRKSRGVLFALSFMLAGAAWQAAERAAAADPAGDPAVVAAEDGAADARDPVVEPAVLRLAPGESLSDDPDGIDI
jgi:hypothetical protein